jgi:hypothetical protein
VEPAVHSVREEDSQPVELGDTELLPTAPTLDRIGQLVVPYQPRIVVYYAAATT